MENIEINPEKIIEGKNNSIPYDLLETVLEQMTNYICLIEYNNEKGTGFFCRIPFPDFCSLLPVLITNNHILGNIDGIEITISMKKKDPIKLKIDKSRKKYTDKNMMSHSLK